jgi:hypothetical protein
MLKLYSQYHHVVLTVNAPCGPVGGAGGSTLGTKSPADQSLMPHSAPRTAETPARPPVHCAAGVKAEPPAATCVIGPPPVLRHTCTLMPCT